VLLTAIVGFVVASVLCGLAQSLPQIVIFRLLQGLFGAALVPLSQGILLDIYSVEERGKAMALFGVSVMVGPVLGPVIGGWLTDNISWRWVFYINVPIGMLAFFGIVAFVSETAREWSAKLDWFGFGMLSVAIGALQLFLDRGEQLDWFSSGEIQLEALVCAGAFYLFLVHTFTAQNSFVNPRLFLDRNFSVSMFFIFVIGVTYLASLALMTPYLQTLMGYPVITAGIVMGPRGIGTMACMFIVGRLIGKVDARLPILFGLVLTALSLWQMTGFSLYMGISPVLMSGLLQGFGLGCTFVPLNTLALSTLPRHLLTQGTAIRAVMRNVGGSIGISVLIGQLTDDKQAVHSRLVEHLRPDNPLAHPALLPAPFSLTDLRGLIALNSEVSRQAEMIAYINDYALMMALVIASMALLLLVRRQAQAR
jgi:MFS transporter, DHA2 family, multidrug resistance protein